MAVGHADGGGKKQVLDIIVRYTSPEIVLLSIAMCQTDHIDYLVYDSERAHFEQAIKMERRPGCVFEIVSEMT